MHDISKQVKSTISECADLMGSCREIMLQIQQGDRHEPVRAPPAPPPKAQPSEVRAKTPEPDPQEGPGSPEWVQVKPGLEDVPEEEWNDTENHFIMRPNDPFDFHEFAVGAQKISLQLEGIRVSIDVSKKPAKFHINNKTKRGYSCVRQFVVRCLSKLPFGSWYQSPGVMAALYQGWQNFEVLQEGDEYDLHPTFLDEARALVEATEKVLSR